MVDVAPPPANFDLARALNREVVADTAPPSGGSGPNPSAWGARRGEFPQGYTTTTAEGRRLLEEQQTRLRQMPPVKHATEIAAERAEREASAEAERRAAGDPQAALAEAHRLNTEALAEVAKLEPLALRARRLIADLEDRAAAARTDIDNAVAAAADRAVAALAAGDDPPLNPRADAAYDAAGKFTNKIAVARAALVRLDADLARARNQATGRARAVKRAAVAVMIDEAVQMADEIAGLDAAVAEKRKALDSLAIELTTQTRILDGTGNGLRLPPKVGRVLIGPPDPRLTSVSPHPYGPPPASPWAARFRALCEPPEAA